MEQQETIKCNELVTKALFRGKRTDNGKWIIGSLIINSHEGVTQYFITTNGMGQIYATSHKVIPETIGQFTGLTDSSGVDIFVGDICKAYAIDNGDEVLSVGFKDGAFVFLKHNWPIRDWKKDYINVIGNVFDNNDLLVN